MELRLAKEEELTEIIILYDLVKKQQFCVWDDEYPSTETIRYDFMHDSLYVLIKETKIIGAISVVPHNEYDNEIFNWSYQKNAREIARVVIHPNYQNKKLGIFMINEISKILKNSKTSVIHLAVEVNNLPAINMYKHCGFHECSTSEMYGHSYYMLEKNIKLSK